MSQDSTTRIAWIDITKAAAAWMVVTAHLLRQGVLTDYLAAVSVAVFYMLAGAAHHAHDDVRVFVIRLLQRIVLPYFVVGLLSIVIYRLLGSYAAAGLGVTTAETTLSEDLWHLVYASSVAGRMKWNESLWFLPGYVVLMLMSEGIEHLARRWQPLRIVLYVAGGLLGYGLIGSGHAGLPWHLETALLVLPLCGLGHVLQTGILARPRQMMGLLAGAALLVWSMQLFPMVELAAGGAFSLRAPKMAPIDTTYLFLILTSAGIIYLVGTLAQVLRVPAMVRTVGVHSLDIVLWNKFPVLLLQVVVPSLFPGFASAFVGGTTATALLIAAILALPCMALCLVWTRIYRRVLSRLRRMPAA